LEVVGTERISYLSLLASGDKSVKVPEVDPVLAVVGEGGGTSSVTIKREREDAVQVQDV
jgi:hypothetical protein